MKVTVNIKGMSCMHCVARIEKALNSMNEVSAKVNLDKSYATVECPDGFDTSKLKDAIEDLGFDVIEIL